MIKVRQTTRINEENPIYVIHMETGAVIEFDNMKDALDRFKLTDVTREERRNRVLKAMITQVPYAGFIWSPRRNNTDTDKQPVKCLELNMVFESIDNASLYTNRFRTEYRYLFDDAVLYDEEKYKYVAPGNIARSCKRYDNPNNIQRTSHNLSWKRV